MVLKHKDIQSYILNVILGMMASRAFHYYDNSGIVSMSQWLRRTNLAYNLHLRLPSRTQDVGVRDIPPVRVPKSSVFEKVLNREWLE